MMVIHGGGEKFQQCLVVVLEVNRPCCHPLLTSCCHSAILWNSYISVTANLIASRGIEKSMSSTC